MDPIRFSIVVFPPPEGPLIMTNSPLNAVSLHSIWHLLLDGVELLVRGEGHTLQGNDFLLSTCKSVHFGQVVEGDHVIFALEVLGWEFVEVQLLSSDLLLLYHFDVLLLIN